MKCNLFAYLLGINLLNINYAYAQQRFNIISYSMGIRNIRIENKPLKTNKI